MRFPPGVRDAGLVGGTLFDLLHRERGERACVRLATHPATEPARRRSRRRSAAPRPRSAGAWREHLERLATPAPDVSPVALTRPARRGSAATPCYHGRSMERLTRRQLVARGGAVAGAAALGSLALAREANRSRPAPAGAAGGPARPLKGLALGGFGPLRSAHDPHDYLEWGNREYVRASRTDVIRLQVSWRFLQPLAPAEPQRSWEQLNRDHGDGALRRLDRQIAAANRDGVRVILGLYHSYPEWSNGTAPGTVEPVTGKPADAKLPLDLSPEGPWAWFVSYLCDRYGGPSRPHIWGLEICNEPNLLCWPQPGVADAVAAMATDRGARGRRAAPTPRCCCCPAPPTSPTRTWSSRASLVATGWPGFTAAVLDGCAGSTPAARRCPRGRTTTTATPRPPTGAATAPRQVIGLLARARLARRPAPVPDRGRRRPRPARPEPLPRAGPAVGSATAAARASCARRA